MPSKLFKKNERVVKVIEGAGYRTASLQTVDSVKKGIVRLVDSTLEYSNETGNEIDPCIPGFRSYLVMLESDD